LKPTTGAAWTQIVPPEFFHEFFFSVDNSISVFNLGFGGESLPAFAAALERRIGS